MASSYSAIYLASRSPRRCELLDQIGVRYTMLLMREDAKRAADVDETPLAGETPAEYVVRIANCKAVSGARCAVARRLPSLPALGADTSVVLDGEILGKPADAAHAIELLSRLSGRTHEVMTAVSISWSDQLAMAMSTSSVTIKPLTDGEIQRYVASGEPLGKAGAYAIQGMGAVFVQAISGSYSGIVGLPLFETAALLRHFGGEA